MTPLQNFIAVEEKQALDAAAPSTYHCIRRTFIPPIISGVLMEL